MKFDKLGGYISQVNSRNSDLKVMDLKGINMNKEFILSVANTVDTDMTKYKVVKPGQFAFNPMHVGRDHLVPISLLGGKQPIIVSPAYTVFEITKPEELLAQYLMFWFRESDFDRHAWFTTDNSVRGGLSWESFCNLKLPIPEKQTQVQICLRALIEKQEELTSRKLELVNAINSNGKTP